MGHSLWLQPTLMMAAAAALGVFLPALDRRLPAAVQSPTAWSHWVASSAAGVRQTLATAASALATILAISVTATMVVIQLAAGMYTSRLLRRFLADRPIRLFLGSFTGSVVYLILILGAVRSASEGAEFVPFVSVLLGRLLTVACLVLLVVFVHYTARSVQAASIVRRVAHDALKALGRLEDDSIVAAAPDGAPRSERPTYVVRAQATGYVQVLDEEQLLAALPRQVTELQIDAAPGDFVFPGVPLLSLWAAGGAAGMELSLRETARLAAAFATGRERTIEQDPAFALRQLTDIALKALSPAINDPTTAEMVVNELGALGAHTAAAGALGGWGTTRRGRVTIRSWRFGLEAILDALAEITEASARQARVLARILDILLLVTATADGPQPRAAVTHAVAQMRGAVDWPALSATGSGMVRERLAAFDDQPHLSDRPDMSSSRVGLPS